MYVNKCVYIATCIINRGIGCGVQPSTGNFHTMMLTLMVAQILSHLALKLLITVTTTQLFLSFSPLLIFHVMVGIFISLNSMTPTTKM